jgi:hypothetical protein
MATSETESKTDERFYTPRAQASTARSTGSFGTPRSYRSSVASSSSDGEYATPRNFDSATFVRPQHLGGGALPRADRRNLLPPHNRSQGSLHVSSTIYQPSYFRFDQEEDDNGDEESRGEEQYKGIRGEIDNYKPEMEPSKKDIDSIFSYTRHGRIQEVDNLLSKGVPTDVRDDNGNTILAIACQNGNKRLAKLALRRCADINASNLRGNTPLHFCYKYGNPLLGEYLISKGADKMKQNDDGQTCNDLLQLY